MNSGFPGFMGTADINHPYWSTQCECNGMWGEQKRRFKCPECGKVWNKQRTGEWYHNSGGSSLLVSLLYGYLFASIIMLVIFGVFMLIVWLIDIL
jgi:hypothetical protein